MKLFNLKNVVTAMVVGAFALVGSGQITNAQNNRQQDRRIQKQEEKARRTQAKADQQRARLEQQRQAAWTRRNRQIVVLRSGNAQSNGTGWYYGNANGNVNRDGRYRVYRNGSYYNITQQGADLLRQAVNQGYQQGFQSGRTDRNGNRNVSWTNSRVYQTGTYGYQNVVTQSQYRYYFQQGFQRGYQDGSNRQYRDDYNGAYQYGTYNNGSPSILETILNTVLRIQSY